jgi:hypothetical protein
MIQVLPTHSGQLGELPIAIEDSMARQMDEAGPANSKKRRASPTLEESTEEQNSSGNPKKIKMTVPPAGDPDNGDLDAEESGILSRQTTQCKDHESDDTSNDAESLPFGIEGVDQSDDETESLGDGSSESWDLFSHVLTKDHPQFDGRHSLSDTLESWHAVKVRTRSSQGIPEIPIFGS